MTTLSANFTPVAEKVACAHCGLPVPAGLIDAAAERQFCCHGCRTVFAVIHECRMDAYYRFRESTDSDRKPAKVTGKAYRECDDATYLDLHAPRVSDSLRRVEFYLEGVHCAACVWLVEKLPAVLPGVIESRLDLGKALVRITWDPAAAPLSRIAQMLDSLGYPPHPARSASARKIRTLTDRKHMIRMGIAGACAGNSMLVALALYAGLFDAMEPIYVTLFRYVSMLLGVVSLAWPGAVFFRGAWASLKTRTPHLDLPIALGLGAGGIAGLVNTLAGRGEIYFDSLTVLVFLLLVGRWLQHRQQGSADDAVELLFSLTPSSARRVETDGIHEVPIAALQIGDVVEVLAGESFPVDGILTQGQSTADQSLLTGETLPRPITVDELVHAGTINVASPVQLRVTATGEETRVGKLMRLVSECARRKAPIVLLANRIAGWFTLIVMVLAVGTLAYWLAKGSDQAPDHAVALLIVACPCALGLSTPLAVAVAIGRAARKQILIKGGDTLERLSKPGTIYLDKTGTLTNGRTTLLHWHGADELKPLVAAIEAQATHPIARAFVAAFGETAPRQAGGYVATQVTQKMQGGIEGTVNGRTLVIGSLAFVRGQAIAIPDWADRQLQRCLVDGHTPVFVCEAGEVKAVAGFGDGIRSDATAALDSLRAQGWKIGILSGDHPMVVQRVAEQLGIPAADARGGLLPEEKLARVQDSLKHATGPVVMVGDGVNDAAALAEASVGIAVHGGAEASLAAAHVYLATPGLTAIVETIDAARRTVRAIRWAMAASLGYNAVAITLSATGLINPLIAALLMPASSLTVLTLALGTKTFGGKS